MRFNLRLRLKSFIQGNDKAIMEGLKKWLQ